MVRAWYVEESWYDEVATAIDLWSHSPEDHYLTAAVDREGYARLLDQGFVVEVDPKATAALGRPNVPLAGQGSGIPGFPCYRTVEETHADAAAIAAAHPKLAAWIDIGDSYDKTVNAATGYDLRVLRLTNTAIAASKPALFVNTAIHSREYTTAELGLRFAEWLIARYDVDPDVTWLLDHHEIHLNLVANPDGRKIAETGALWRKNTRPACADTSRRGVDLNRNFDFGWGCCGGSTADPCLETYRGSGPSSEPEDAAVRDYLRALFPDQRPDDTTTPAPSDSTGIMLDVHSFGTVVLWSWGFTNTQPPAPNGAQLYTLGRKYSYFTQYFPMHGSFGTVDGATKDFAYGDLGVPGFTIELGSTFFEQCPMFEGVILPDNLESLLYTAKVTRTPYRTPAGPDSEPSVPKEAVTAGTPVALSAIVDDTRYSNRNGTEPTEQIYGVEYFVDTPPWDPGATPLAMTADDGTFDEAIEAVSATIDTSGLAVGRHTVFVQARDTNLNTGAVSAVFLDIRDASAPILEGFVRATDGTPLMATVTAGRFETTSDPVTGYYRFDFPADSYEVTVSAPGYAPMQESVEVPPLASLERDFRLPPLLTFFDDDVEGGNLGWTADSPWAITTEAASSGSSSWTDSPGGSNSNSVDASLTSPSFDFSNHVGVVVSFQLEYDLTPALHIGYVEVSTDGGGTWEVIEAFTGPSEPWHPRSLPLPTLDGAADARVRFRMEGNGGSSLDGYWIDDVLIEAALSLSVFADGFETGDTSGWSVTF